MVCHTDLFTPNGVHGCEVKGWWWEVGLVVGLGSVVRGVCGGNFSEGLVVRFGLVVGCTKSGDAPRTHSLTANAVPSR